MRILELRRWRRSWVVCLCMEDNELRDVYVNVDDPTVPLNALGGRSILELVRDDPAMMARLEALREGVDL